MKEKDLHVIIICMHNGVFAHCVCTLFTYSLGYGSQHRYRLVYISALPTHFCTHVTLNEIAAIVKICCKAYINDIP